MKYPIPRSHHASMQSTFERFIEEMGGNCIYSAIVHHPLGGGYTNTRNIVVYHLEDVTLVATVPDLFDQDHCHIDNRDYIGVTIAGEYKAASKISNQLKTLEL